MSVQKLKQNHFYGDTAMIRRVEGGEVKVCRQIEVRSELNKITNMEYIKKLEMIQSCVINMVSCHEPVLLNFIAPINQESATDTINY